MKKIISIIIVALMLAGALVGCGGVKECEMCGQEYEGKTYKGEFLGEELDMCKDCHDEIKALEKEIEDLLG